MSRFFRYLNVLILMVCLLISVPAQAADVLSMAPLDARSEGRVGQTRLLPTGQYSLGLHYHQTQSPLTPRHLGQIGNDRAIVSRAMQGSIGISVGLTDWLELGALVHGTSENPSIAQTDQLLFGHLDPDISPVQQGIGMTTVTTTAKVALLQKAWWAVSVIGFGDFITAATPSYAFTRPQNHRYGWLVMNEFGKPQSLSLTTNLGFRYRQDETIGTTVLGNELLYQARLSSQLVGPLGSFVSGQGRRIQAHRDQQALVLEGAEMMMGFSLNYHRFALSAYGGRGHGREAIGHGQSFWGLSMAATLGQMASRSILSKDQIKATPRVNERHLEDRNPSADESLDDYMIKAESLEPISSMELFEDVDRILSKDIMEDDAHQNDFRALPNQPEEESLSAGEEIDRVEIEVKKLREAEEIARLEEQKREARQEALRRQAGWKEFQKQSAEEERLRKNAQQNIEYLPGVTDEDYNWQGLGSEDDLFLD